MVASTTCVVYLACLLQSAGAPYFDAKPIAKAVCRYHKTNWHYVEKHLVLAVMFNESRFRQSARSNTADIGLMQLHCPKKVAKRWWLCSQCDVKKRDCNIRQGIKWLGVLRNKYTSLYPSRMKNFRWVQYYNYRSKGYAKKVLRIRSDLIVLGKVKCGTR